MAASIMRCRFCSKSSKNIFRIPCRFVNQSYYVLLPEVPPDTPETNPVMRVYDPPEFTKINPDNIITGNAKYAITYDVALGKHTEKLKDPNFKKSFSSVFDPIEQLSVPLNFSHKISKNLSYLQAGGFRTAFQRVHPQVERAKNDRWTNEPLYNAVKEVAADHGNLTGHQSRVAELYLLEARLNGIELQQTEKKDFIRTLSRLIESKNHFRNKVMLNHNMFSHTLDNAGPLSEMPKVFKDEMATDPTKPSKGPWKVTLNQNVYAPFLEYCSDRMQRWNVWHAHCNRASAEYDQQNLSNHIVIKEIRQLRKDLSSQLGYENFADMSMETKMAGNLENVLNMLDNMKNKIHPLASEELTQLQQFAISEGFEHKLQQWDIPYWRRRQRDHLFNLESGAEAEYFPLPRVMDGLFSICKQLFGIEIKNCTGEVEVWHDDVLYYKVIDSQDGSDLASFYVDPYSRPDKLARTWMESARENSALMQTKPVSFLNMSIAPPFGSRPALLTAQDVQKLFYEFGHGLQQMLTTVDYSEIAGQRNVEWDALQVCAYTMSMFAKHPTTLASISGHYETGEQIPQSMVQALLKSQRHLYSYNLMNQLYLSAFDMEMYISDRAWGNVMESLWEDYMPSPYYEDDNTPCSLAAIFSDQYAAAYYSFLWAEMLATDIFQTFEESGLEDLKNAAPIGKRFRETFLSQGGGVAASEVFRQFQGRDPSQQAFLKYYGIS